MTSVDEFANISSVGEALKGIFDTPQARRAMGPGRMAQRTWFQMVGPVEREHTCGTYVAAPRRQGDKPTFVVYTDTRARAVDFNANREVYRARMAAAGWDFGEIVFKQTKRPPAEKKKAAQREAKAAPALLPELSPEEEAYVRAAVASQPEHLREKAYKAMSASMRRRKLDGTQNL